MMPDRIKSVSNLLQQVISDIIHREIKDPRVSSFIAITGVTVSRDLRSAKVFISAIEEKTKVEHDVEGLNSAKGFIRRRVAGEVDLKRIPVFTFFPDDSIKRGVQVIRLIDKIRREDEQASLHEDDAECCDSLRRISDESLET